MSGAPLSRFISSDFSDWAFNTSIGLGAVGFH
jgi:hypothetical protein